MTEDDDKKVFYLFTKTAREKEEWFNHFMVAAKFMEDWEHQNPKEGLLKNYVYIRTSISAAVCLHFVNNLTMFFQVPYMIPIMKHLKSKSKSLKCLWKIILR